MALLEELEQAAGRQVHDRDNRPQDPRLRRLRW
jgi:hypothetical protein